MAESNITNCNNRKRSRCRSVTLTHHQLYDPLQRVFDYLDVRDLFMIASISRTFYHHVETYCERMCRGLNVKTIENELKEDHQFRRDVVVYNQGKDENRYKWLFLNWVRLLRRRETLAKYHLTYLRDPYYIFC